MGNHLSPRTIRIIIYIRIGIELCKKIPDCRLANCKMKSLITVISTSEITRFEKLGHCHLRHFFSISKNAKLGLPCKHFFTP